MKNYIGNCPNPSCMAANSGINEVNKVHFPESIQEELKRQKLWEKSHKKCTYCGTIWVMDSSFPDGYKITATRNINSDETVWIL